MQCKFVASQTIILITAGRNANFRAYEAVHFYRGRFEEVFTLVITLDPYITSKQP